MQMSSLAALWIAVKRDAHINDMPEVKPKSFFYSMQTFFNMVFLKCSSFHLKAGDLINLVPKPNGTTDKDLIHCLAVCERDILIALNFEISFAEPFSIVALYTITIEDIRVNLSKYTQKIYYCTSYLVWMNTFKSYTIILKMSIIS